MPSGFPAVALPLLQHCRTLILPLAVVAVLTLSGCAAVGPDYASPEPSLPAKWNSAPGDGLVEGSVDTTGLATWWTAFNDDILTGLISRAVQSNNDVRLARARIIESRATLGISSAGHLPSVDASASGRVTRGSEETGAGVERDSYAAGFDASWEIDIFGGIRRSVEAAEADLEASREGLRDALVTLAAEAAINYVDVRTFQRRLATAEANLQTQEETYGLIKALYDSGIRSGLDLEQARLNLENTRSQVPALRTGLEEALNRLAVVLGEAPGALHDELSVHKPIPTADDEVAVGVPADIVRRRPDIRRAERELAAQTARVGVATAELYPKLTLTGSLGVEALSLDRLFLYGSRTYGYGPRLTLPVFHAGALRRAIEVQDARLDQALIRYEQTVLAALEEVENAIVTYAQDRAQRQSLVEAAGAARNAAELSLQLYLAGLADFQNVLDAQRTLLSLEDRLVVSEGGVSSDLIRIYKSLGGGWTPDETLATESVKGS